MVASKSATPCNVPSDISDFVSFTSVMLLDHLSTLGKSKEVLRLCLVARDCSNKNEHTGIALLGTTKHEQNDGNCEQAMGSEESTSHTVRAMHQAMTRALACLWER
jgi:hypothetical protein